MLTTHSAYNFKKIAESGVLILDTRNAFKGVQAPNIARIGDELGEVHPETPKEKVLVSG
jgi:UDP-N-acetyl-D-glucosamine dehydrogenase